MGKVDSSAEFLGDFPGKSSEIILKFSLDKTRGGGGDIITKYNRF